MTTYVLTPYEPLRSFDGAVSPRRDVGHFLTYGNDNKEITWISFINSDDIANDIITTAYHRLCNVGSGDVVLFQVPEYSAYGNYEDSKLVDYVHKIGGKAVALVHDLDSLRFGASYYSKDFAELLDKFDLLILPSEKMHQYLVKQGHTLNDYVIQKPWDMNLDANTLPIPSNLNQRSERLVVAGNLSNDKISYLNYMDNALAKYIDVYGSQNDTYQKAFSDELTWKGAFSQQDLLDELTLSKPLGGLCIEGNGVYGSKEKTGYASYAMYNWPVKFSMFVASLTPIITLEHANIAHIVKKAHLGVVYPSLYDIPSDIETITKDIGNSTSYEQLISGSREITSGNNIKSVWAKVLKKLGTK